MYIGYFRRQWRHRGLIGRPGSDGGGGRVLTQRLGDEDAGVEQPLLVSRLLGRLQRLLAALSRLLEALHLDVAVAELVTQPRLLGCRDRERRLELLLPSVTSD